LDKLKRALYTPDKRSTLIILCNLSLVCFVLGDIIYFKRLLMQGAFSPDADAIAIPIMQGLVSMLIWAVPFNIIWWATTRNYPGRTYLIFWRNIKRPYFYFVTFFLCGLIGVFVLGLGSTVFHVSLEYLFFDGLSIYGWASIRASYNRSLAG